MLLSVRQEDFDSVGLRHAWAELSSDSPAAGLFTTHEWCRCWAETVGRNSRPAVLRFIDETGATAGLAPLCTTGHAGGKWLQFMGRERASGDHLDLLWRPDAAEDCAEAFVRYLDELAEDHGGLLLGEMTPTSPTRAAVIRWAESRGLSWRERELRRVPYIDLPQDFAAFLAGLSPNMRYHVRRRSRGLKDMQGACVRVVRDRGEAEETLTAFFDLHRRRWEKDGLSGNFSDHDMQAFLRRFCIVAAERGWLRLHTLQIHEQTYGVLVAFHFKGTAYYYQMGWHPDCPLASPGVVLLAGSIQLAIAEGLSRYDLLRGEEAYKFRWTSQTAEAATLVVGRSPGVRAALHAEEMKDALKRAVCRCLGQRSWERARQLLTGRPA